MQVCNLDSEHRSWAPRGASRDFSPLLAALIVKVNLAAGFSSQDTMVALAAERGHVDAALARHQAHDGSDIWASRLSHTMRQRIMKKRNTRFGGSR